ncbi:MAG: hypothetical protein PHI27_08645 [Eubacteriales bacterium]|nr:hypothetical protein [Eubacteriales bacterium]MDD3882307.1 hypothetical protein [Eubacteriales bacterium]MDD4512053.1 hypothetical protein [Eubacteriales bacterium]
MKKLVLLALLLMLPASALAETVGYAGDDLYIKSYTAENGETLYYTGGIETDFVKSEDVNFDGVSDIVAMTRMGASNCAYVFFIKTENGYLHASETVWNYELDKERGLVVSHTSDGYAGVLHETKLYRWQGGELELIRAAYSKERASVSLDGEKITETTYLRDIDISVIDYEHPLSETNDGEYMNEIFSENVSLEDESGYLDAYNRERAALYEGL